MSEFQKPYSEHARKEHDRIFASSKPVEVRREVALIFTMAGEDPQASCYNCETICPVQRRWSNKVCKDYQPRPPKRKRGAHKHINKEDA